MIQIQKNNNSKIQEVLDNFLKNEKAIKITLIIGAGVLSLYLLGKAFNGLATTVRGFNNLKSAINGK